MRSKFVALFTVLLVMLLGMAAVPAMAQDSEWHRLYHSTLPEYAWEIRVEAQSSVTIVVDVRQDHSTEGLPYDCDTGACQNREEAQLIGPNGYELIINDGEDDPRTIFGYSTQSIVLNPGTYYIVGRPTGWHSVEVRVSTVIEPITIPTTEEPLPEETPIPEATDVPEVTQEPTIEVSVAPQEPELLATVCRMDNKWGPEKAPVGYQTNLRGPHGDIWIYDLVTVIGPAEDGIEIGVLNRNGGWTNTRYSFRFLDGTEVYFDLIITSDPVTGAWISISCKLSSERPIPTASPVAEDEVCEECPPEPLCEGEGVTAYFSAQHGDVYQAIHDGVAVRNLPSLEAAKEVYRDMAGVEVSPSQIYEACGCLCMNDGYVLETSDGEFAVMFGYGNCTDSAVNLFIRMGYSAEEAAVMGARLSGLFEQQRLQDSRLDVVVVLISELEGYAADSQN